MAGQAYIAAYDAGRSHAHKAATLTPAEIVGSQPQPTKKGKRPRARSRS